MKFPNFFFTYASIDHTIILNRGYVSTVVELMAKTIDGKKPTIWEFPIFNGIWSGKFWSGWLPNKNAFLFNDTRSHQLFLYELIGIIKTSKALGQTTNDGNMSRGIWLKSNWELALIIRECGTIITRDRR